METNVQNQDIQIPQITATPEVVESKGAVKVKDPRKVAAGKALAEKNVKRRAKQVSEASEVKEVKESNKISTIYNGIQKSAILVSSGFVLYHGYNFFKDLYSRRVKQRRTVDVKVGETSPQLIEINDLDF